MTDRMVRSLPEEVLARLKSRAEAHGCSLEAEARAILEQETMDHDRKALVDELRAFRRSLGPGPFSDSAEMLQDLRGTLSRDSPSQ